jgi:hypothetical protein
MNTYLVTVTAELPYPISKEFRMSGWDFPVAIRRAVFEYRKFLKEERGKSKKIKSLSVKAIRI